VELSYPISYLLACEQSTKKALTLQDLVISLSVANPGEAKNTHFLLANADEFCKTGG